ncbi:MAG: hypothetical protein K2M19_00635 [Muribaculaceae bacterium]|nr:hypothetical protein [Muribaculaceae bacterium]
MKKFISLVASIVALVMGISCSSDDILVDYDPIEIKINLVDKDGNNLLSEKTEGNWLGQPFSVEYKNETYTADWSVLKNTIHESREYLHHFYGFAAMPQEEWTDHGWIKKKGEFYLSFGEFDRGTDQNIKIKFMIPGREGADEIELTNEVKNSKSKTTISLNGKEFKGEDVTIVLPEFEE